LHLFVKNRRLKTDGSRFLAAVIPLMPTTSQKLVESLNLKIKASGESCSPWDCPPFFVFFFWGVEALHQILIW